MNSVQLIGRLTRDPEVRETGGGTTVCRLGLAIQRRERDAAPVYIEVKAFGAQAKSCGQYLAKGREVAVTGRLETDKWDAQDGSKRSLTYVIAQSVDFLRRPTDNGSTASSGAENGSAPEPAPPSTEQAPALAQAHPSEEVPAPTTA
jgi:single-strand DNA-binding protein